MVRQDAVLNYLNNGRGPQRFHYRSLQLTCRSLTNDSKNAAMVSVGFSDDRQQPLQSSQLLRDVGSRLGPGIRT